jgi:hypothetical protein
MATLIFRPDSKSCWRAFFSAHAVLQHPPHEFTLHRARPSRESEMKSIAPAFLLLTTSFATADAFFTSKI